jgi:hypothetical protein
MDRNVSFLFPEAGWRGRFDPRDLNSAVHQFANTLFEGWNDFRQGITLGWRSTFESRQISDASPHATTGVARHVDDTTENGNVSWLRVIAGVQMGRPRRLPRLIFDIFLRRKSVKKSPLESNGLLQS